MVPAFKLVQGIIPISKTAGATAVSQIVDRKGWNYAIIPVGASTADVVSNTFSVLKIEEGDTTSSFATFAGAVSGTDYTIATNAYTSTTNDNVWGFGVDCRPRKRYLRVTVSPQTTMVVGGQAVLLRPDIAPTTSAAAGALNLVLV